MFSLMGNCISCVSRRRQPKKPVVLALLGVDNAGKTTASFSFAGETIDPDVAPTIGFRSVKFPFDCYDINLYDIGGGKNIRPVWKNYFPEVYGFIYMVDSSTADRMEEAREVFRECLEHPHVSGKPVLLLANKQDKPEALDEVDICEQLNLETVVNINKCPCRIDTCSALRGTGRKMDPRIKEGMRWLLAVVEKHWEELKGRVDADMKAMDELRKAEAAARRERVRKQREEREQKEEEERKRLGIEKKDSDDEDIINGDPFRPLDLGELKKKEEKLKAEKKRLKELESGEKAGKDRALSSRSARSQKDMDSNNSSEVGGRLFSPRTLPSVLPPLEPLGTPFLDDGGDNNNKKKKKKKKKTPRTSAEPAGSVVEKIRQSKDVKTTDDDDDIVLATPRSQPVFTETSLTEKSARTISNIKVSTHDDFPSREMLAKGITRVSLQPLDGGSTLEDLETVTPRTRKVKKKKLRQLGANQNGQARAVGVAADGDKSEVTSSRPLPRLTSLDGGEILEANLGGDATGRTRGKRLGGVKGVEERYEMSPRNILSQDSPTSAHLVDKRLSKVSRHSQMHSNVSLESDQLGSRTWGMAEDLPAVADDAVAYKQPNFTDDETVML